MRTAWIVLESLGAGVVLTLVTGSIDATPAGLLGARWYGLPFAWLRRLVVAPQYNPWAVDYSGLILDLAIWFVLVFIVLYSVLHYRKHSIGSGHPSPPS